jgi:hypothetical protein
MMLVASTNPLARKKSTWAAARPSPDELARQETAASRREQPA